MSTNGRKTWLAALSLLVAASMGVKADETPAAAGSLLKLKAGTCTFTILDAQGVNPLPGMQLVLASPADGTVAAKTVTDNAGACALDIAQGRYVMSVQGMDLAILEASTDQTLTECRIVLPDEAMVVGGEDTTTAPTEEKSTKKAGGFWLASGGSMQPFVIGTVVVLAAAGGGYAVYENNNDDNDDDGGADKGGGNTPPPTTTRTERRVSRPTPPPVSP